MSSNQAPGWIPSGPPRWAYKVSFIGGAPQVIEQQLQQLGAEGWELVSTTMGAATGAQLNNTPVSLAIFKRPYWGHPGTR